MVYTDNDAILNLTAEQVKDILNECSHEAFVDEDYKETKKAFAIAEKVMGVAESRVEKRLFVFRDRVLAIMNEIGEDHEDWEFFDEYLTEFMQEATSVMVTSGAYVYTDYDFYGHEDVNAFWIPSTC